MSHETGLPPWLWAIIAFLLVGWIAFQSFLDSLGITFGQFKELVEIGTITAATVAVFIAAECKKFELFDTWTGRLFGGVVLGIISAFASSYIWLNYDATMRLSAVLGALLTVATVHLLVFGILLLIDWWIKRKNNQSQNQSPTPSHRRRQSENELTAEAERMRTGRTRTRQRQRERDSRYR